MDEDAPGPVGVCAHCGVTGKMHMHSSSGWLDRKCALSATTILEVRWIGGKKYIRRLKGPLKTKSPALMAGAVGE